MEKIDHHQALEQVKPELDPNTCRVRRTMDVLEKLQDSERKNEEFLAQIIALKDQVSENAALRISAAENRALKELTAHNRDLMNQLSQKVTENAALTEGVVVYSMMIKELKHQLFNATSELWQTRDENKSKYAALLEVNETLKRQLRTATLQLCQIRKKMHHRQRREAVGSTGSEVEKELEDLKIQIREMEEEMKCSYIKDKVRVQQTDKLKNQIWKLEEKMSGLQEESLEKEVKLEEGIKLLNRQITDLQELVMRTDSDMSEFEKVKMELREQKKLEKEDPLESEEEKEFSAFAAEIEALKDQVSEKEAEILYRDVWIQTFRNNLNFSHSVLHHLSQERKQLAETTSARCTEMEREIEDLKTVVNGEEEVPLQHHENVGNGWEEHHESPQETCEEGEEAQKTEEVKNQIMELEEEISALQEDSLQKESNLQEEVQLLNQFQELVFKTDEYKVELEQVKQELEEKRKQEMEKQLEREKKEEQMSALAAECGALKEQLSKREEELKYQDGWIQAFRKDLSLSNSTLHQLIEERKHLVETTRQTEVERTIEDLKEMLKDESLGVGFQRQQHQEDLILANGREFNGEETSQEEMTRSSLLEGKVSSVHQPEDMKLQIRESEENRSDLEEGALGEESMLEEGVRLLNQQIVALQELVMISESDVPEFQKVKLEPREKIKPEMEEHFESEVEKELSALAEEIEALKEQVSEKNAEIVHQDVWIKAFRSNLKFSNSTLHQLLEERKHLVEEESARQMEMEREFEDLKTDDEEEFLLALQLQHQENPVLENGWKVTSSEGLQEISEEEMRSNTTNEESNPVQQTEDLKDQIRELEEEVSTRQEDSLRRESKLEDQVQLLNQQNVDLQGIVCRAGEELVDLEKVKRDLEEKKKQEMQISTLAVEIEALREKLSRKEEEIKYQDAWIQSLRKDLNLSNSALNQLVQTARQAEMEKVIDDLRTMVREEEEGRQRPHQQNGWKVNSEGLQETLEQEISCSLLKDKVQQTGNLRNQIRKLEEMSLRKESRLEDGVKLLNQQIMELQELNRKSDEYKAELEAVKLELEEKKKQEMEEQLEKERKEEEMSALVAEIEALKEQLSKREEELNDQDAWIQTFRKNLSFSNSTLHQLIEERKHLEETTRQTKSEKTVEDLKGELNEESLGADPQGLEEENLMLENGFKLKSEGPQDMSEEVRSSFPKEDLSLQQTMDLKNRIKELEEEMSALQEDSLRRQSKLEEEVVLLNEQIMELQELVFMADEYKAELERVKTELEEGKKNPKKEEQVEVEKKDDLFSALAAEIKGLKEQVSEKETEIEYQDVWIKTFQKNLNLCSETLRQLVCERKHLVETASTRQTEMKREIEGLKMKLREEGQISQPQEELEETKGTRLPNLEREVYNIKDCRFGKTGAPPFLGLALRADDKEPLKRKIKELRQKMDKKMEEQERKRLERERKKEEREGNQRWIIVAPPFAQCNST